ncbi:carboxypeptidase-like regulatory domain-containing protein [Botrimarina hoheduenensis]|uniref:Carboxypeptidase regulatory-like domain-containing protein n=1 Tax=Botrimarina hoheduenensis TaxID=2528000 RepID=A0A5C5VRA5_9BACT|nr:carboxypeptidase-like regulatory domain-containing protein [Botrimarina hoheduenensis]TWT40690.1 hypothetical protein Pla111_33350 [Botrimarina hoheduenensis]
MAISVSKHEIIWFYCLVAAVLAGCGQSDFAPVSGVVTYNGSPLGGATVTFRPVDGRQFSYAVTSEDGTYQLVVSGAGGHTGAVVGEHRVKVTAVAEPSNKEGAESDLGSLAQIGQEVKVRYLVPQKYDAFETSGLTCVVSRRGTNAANFELTE